MELDSFTPLTLLRGCCKHNMLIQEEQKYLKKWIWLYHCIHWILKKPQTLLLYFRMIVKNTEGPDSGNA